MLPRDHARRNQEQEDAQMREWVAKEDDFVLKQSKKKAEIRVREGRAKPIDWLAVILNVTDNNENLLEDDPDDAEIEVVDPESVVEELSLAEVQDVEKGIDHYLVLESNEDNCTYWKVGVTHGTFSARCSLC